MFVEGDGAEAAARTAVMVNRSVNNTPTKPFQEDIVKR
tara:strand:- start:4 stop:117 length:114 start_codon:yes stop_codon:yes gene_type:complete